MLQLCPPSGGHHCPRRNLCDVHLCFNDTFQGSSPRSAAPLLSSRWPPMAHRPGTPQGPSTACFLVPSQTCQHGSQMLPGAAEHPQLPPNYPGVIEGRPTHLFFCGASIYRPLQSCLFAGFTRRWCFECQPACGDGLSQVVPSVPDATLRCL